MLELLGSSYFFALRRDREMTTKGLGPMQAFIV